MSSSLTENLQSGYSQIATAARRAGLSDDGCTFLMKALDPFHDTPLKHHGLPDNASSKSVVREYKRSMVVDRSNLDGDGKWNFRVDLLPFLSATLDANGIFNGIDVQDAVSIFGLGEIQQTLANPENHIGKLYPLTVKKYNNAAGANKCYPGSTYDAAFTFVDSVNRKTSGLAPVDYADFSQQLVRVVACGFEVTDITPAQYRGGQATCYRMQTEYDTEKHTLELLDATGAFPGSRFTPCNILALPPPTAAAMLQLPHTKQWNAEEGCYAIGILDPEVMDEWTSVLDHSPFVFTNHLATMAQNVGANPNFWKAPNNPVPGDRIPPPIPIFITSTETNGVLFEGLDPNAVFQINARWMIEYVPDMFDNDMVLADQSAAYDPAAIEVYCRTIRNLPPGVFVSENPLGEWFDYVMNIVSTVAVPVGAAISGALTGDPTMGAKIGSTVGGLATWGRDFNDSFREKPKYGNNPKV